MKDEMMEIIIRGGTKKKHKNRVENYANIWGKMHDVNRKMFPLNIATVIGQMTHMLLLNKLQNKASQEDEKKERHDKPQYVKIFCQSRKRKK
jgi:hypothetical protein